MSASIDQRIVEMQFDNKQFEDGIQTSLKSLDNLDKGLRLKDGAKGLETIGKTADNLSFDGLNSGIYAVQQKFSAMEVVAITALTNITNKAINAGEQLVKSLSVDQIAAGFAKFGSKTSSVATLVAQGNELEVVNEQLDRLNWFTDETSYNFTDMVANIAKFTASGKGLEESVTAMEGIANWAALSGQNATTASRAMYQLSQALGAGIMRKEDYRSIQNASMDTDEFRQKCLDAAVALGTLQKNADGTYQSLVNGKESFTKSQFADHLTEDAWFTSDVMMKVFTEYSAAVDQIYDYADEKGITASQAIEELGGNVDAFGLKAFKAAQEARTWGDAVDSVKDAVSTGWMNTFELIFGNQKEATKLWTDLANAMYDVFASGGEARNELLKEWKDAGGRDALIESFWNIWDAVEKVASSIKSAFGEIFAPLTSGKLLTLTDKLKAFTASLIISDDAADKLKRTFKGVFAVFDIFKKVLGTVGNAIAKLLGSDGMKSLADTMLEITARIGDFLVELNDKFSTNGLAGLLDGIAEKISSVFKGILGGTEGFGDAFSAVGDTISGVLGRIWEGFKTVFGWIKENISIKRLLGVATAAFGTMTGKELFGAAKGVNEFIDNLVNRKGKKGDPESLKAKISDLFEGLNGSLKALTSNIKVSSVVSIAVAIGILTASLNSLSKIKADDALKGVAAMGVMFKMLNQSMGSITKTLSANGSKGLGKASLSMILIAKAMNVLADAMQKFAGLSWEDIAQGLVSVGGGLTIFCGGLKLLNGITIPLRTSVALVIIAESCKILADALIKFGTMDWGQIGRGLTAMGGALAELIAVVAALNKLAGFGSIVSGVAVLVIVKSLSGLADGLSKFGDMRWKQIIKGLGGMGGALAEVSAALIAVSKLAGFKSLFAGKAITTVIDGLSKLADSLAKFGAMSWDEIVKGLTGLGGGLAEVAGLTGLLGKLAGMSSLLGAGSIRITIGGLNDLADSFVKFGTMNWDEIGRGLTGLGGALTEIAAITGINGLVSGFAGFVGSGSILLTIQGLQDLADAMQTLGSMSWEQITNGLSAMAGALGTTALGGIANIFSGLGAASIKAVADALIPLADAVMHWGNLSIPDNLPTQLSELATGVSSFWASGWGADSIDTVASGLGILADSVRKWDGVTLPDNIGTNLQSLSGAISLFWTAGAGAGAIESVAVPLGDMADSVRKWEGVTIPDNLGTNLQTLAGGVSTFWAVGLGAGGIATVATPLGDMADSVKKWSDITIMDSIGIQLGNLATGISKFSFAGLAGFSMSAIITPLAQMADSVNAWNGVRIRAKLREHLENLAMGILAFNGEFFAGMNMSNIVGPLSDMADSVAKWADISLPEFDFKATLTDLAKGISAFWTSGFGASNIAEVAVPLGDLADSIEKWAKLTLPSEDVMNFMPDLATAINSFWNSGSGASAISEVAAPLGTLALSMNNWSEVTLPNFDLKTTLTNLALGIGTFWSSGFGAANIAELVTPLGNLAGSVKKWATVTVVDTLGERLENLATGVSKFNFAGWSGSGMQAVVEPLKNLATSVNAWNGVRIRPNLKDHLENLAKGVLAFNVDFFAGTNMSNIAGPLGEMAVAVSKWNDITLDEAFGEKLGSIAEALNKFDDVGNIGFATTSMQSIATAAGQLSRVDFNGISTGFSTIIDSVKQLGDIDASVISSTDDVTAAIATMMTNMGLAVTNNTSTITSAFGALMTTVLSKFTGYESQFYTHGKTFATKIIDGFKANPTALSAAATESTSAAASELYNQYNNWYTAGAYLTIGLAAGIRSGKADAINAAVEVATDALKEAKAALDEHSPSKKTYEMGKFFDLGMANGIKDYGSDVTKRAGTMAETVLAKLSTMMASDLDTTPTIRPVMDLSGVEEGLDGIGTMFGGRTLSIGGSVNRARSAVAVDNAQQSPDANQNGSTVNYTFEQNNYSPKALDRLEIYRQTRNQFAMMKGVKG